MHLLVSVVRSWIRGSRPQSHHEFSCDPRSSPHGLPKLKVLIDDVVKLKPRHGPGHGEHRGSSAIFHLDDFITTVLDTMHEGIILFASLDGGCGGSLRKERDDGDTGVATHKVPFVSFGLVPAVLLQNVEARTTSRVGTPNTLWGSKAPACLRTLVTIGTVELIRLEMTRMCASCAWPMPPVAVGYHINSCTRKVRGAFLVGNQIIGNKAQGLFWFMFPAKHRHCFTATSSFLLRTLPIQYHLTYRL